MTKRKTRNTLVVDFRRDIRESYVREAMPEVLDILLKDRTTGRNILWCTKDYEARGAGFGERDEIRAELISKPATRSSCRARARAPKSSGGACRKKARCSLPPGSATRRADR